MNSCRVQFAKGGGAGVCSLRSQFMLVAHDSTPFAGIFAADKGPCMSLSAELEECSKVCGVRPLLQLQALSQLTQEVAVSDARLNSVSSHIKQLEQALEASSTARTFAIKLGGRGVGEGDADAALRADETPATWLADSAMLLRDPPLLHLLLHETVCCHSSLPTFSPFLRSPIVGSCA